MADRRSQKALADFVAEAQETIDGLGRDLMHLEGARHAEEPDPQVLNAVFRAAHSLKGLASMFGVERMAQLAHALEDQLDAIRMGRRALDGPTLDLLLESPEIFSLIIAEESAGGPAQSSQASERMAARLRESGKKSATTDADVLGEIDLEPAVRSVLTEYEEHRLRTNLTKGTEVYSVGIAFELASFDRGLGDLNSRLKPLGEVISTLPAPDAGDPNIIAFEILFGSREPIGKVQEAAGPGATVQKIARRRATAGVPAVPRQVEPSPPPTPAEIPPALEEVHQPPSALVLEERHLTEAAGSIRSISQTVRVDIHKLDRLMNIVGELVLLRTNLFAIAERLRGGEDGGAAATDLQRENRSLERKLDELQTDILEVRMVPLGQIFDKLIRMVRKLSKEVEKEVDLDVQGGDVELDKLIIEELSDPLMHLLRNAIDHAIESPEVRLRAGKGRTGRVSLTAAQKGNRVQIVVEDDGAGIDEDRVREVAIERGLFSAKAIQELSRRELLNLIFAPGFSTAPQVTAMSGRGVGLDVVKNNISGLSGIIELKSEHGKGTRFEITLPTTLAIIRALVVSVSGKTYAVPLNSVIEILSVDPSEFRIVEPREIISVRGTTLPIVRLGKLFGYEASENAGDIPWPMPEGTPWPPQQVFVVVVGLAHERLGLAVDELVGQQDVVVKPLGKALEDVRGIAGATDLGSLSTVLVLDVGGILEEVMGSDPLHAAVGW